MANSAPNYKLTLYNKENSQTPLLTLCNNEKTEFKKAHVALTSLEINKEMYQPGKITALVQFTDCDISIIDEFEKLLGMCVDLEDGVSNNAIAKGYILCDFEPEFRPSNGLDTLYVKLSIFSPEQTLTYNKRNACYVAKKLGDVFEEIAIQADITNTHDNLQNIKCDGKELIQPYMVQFEETTVDFLSRMANRCGEFLFFENGTWQLGAAPQTSPIVINKYKSLSFHKFTARKPQSYCINNYAIDKEKEDKAENDKKIVEQKKEEEKTAELEEFKKTTEYTKLSEKDKKIAEEIWSKQYDIKKKEFISNIQYAGPSDEYLECIKKKNGKGWWETVKDKYTEKTYYIKKVPIWLKQDNIWKMLLKAVGDIAQEQITILAKMNDKADSYNEKFFDNLEDKEEQCKKSENICYPLTSTFGPQNFSSTFYKEIEENEKKSERLKIHINLGTNYMCLHLGDTIQIQNKKYIITKLSTLAKTEENTGGNLISNLEVDAAPVYGSPAKCYPSPLAGGTIKKSEPQLATVTSVNDPMQIGRIQICYPWQKKDEESLYSSPWIRISAACATAGGGLKFMPQKGDEIMVGYENGNIERPYMIGSLPTKTTTGVGGDYMLQSPNGQYIKFDNSSFSYEDLLSTFVPAYNVVTQFMPQSSIADFSDMTKFGGGIEIGDKLGFYKVSMSSADRAIAIKSTWGDVNIDAFTGITISAPNGDIKITGKNVTITAGNELTLKSGTNASKKRTTGYKAREAGSMLAATAMNKVSDVIWDDFKLDLSLLRMIAECFAKPIGGTMLIKSARFMRLEAGKGKTELPMGVEENEDRDEARKKEVIAYNTIKAANNTIDQIILSAHDTIKTIESLRTEYGNKLNDLKKIATSNSNGFELQYKGKVYEKDLATSEDFKFDKILEACKKDNNYKVDDAMENLGQLTLIDKKKQTEHPVFNTTKDSFKQPLGRLIEKVHEQQAVTVKDSEKQKLIMACEPHYKTSSSLHEKENMSNDDITKMRDTISTVFTAHKKEIDNLIKLDVDKLNMESVKKLKRHIAYDILEELKKGKTILIQDETDLISSMSILFKDTVRKSCEITPQVCEKAKDWDNFLGCIQAYDEEKDVNRSNSEKAKTIGKAILNHIGWEDLSDGWKENQVTNPKVKGEILMSDSSGNTVNINGTTIQSDASTLIPKLIAELKGI